MAVISHLPRMLDKDESPVLSKVCREVLERKDSIPKAWSRDCTQAPLDRSSQLLHSLYLMFFLYYAKKKEALDLRPISSRSVFAPLHCHSSACGCQNIKLLGHLFISFFIFVY